MKLMSDEKISTEGRYKIKEVERKERKKWIEGSKAKELV